MDVMALSARLTLDTSGFNTNLTASESQLRGTSTRTVALGNLMSNMVIMGARALKRVGKDIIDTGMDFDSTMSQVKALTGANEDEFDALRKKAQKVGETTKFTAQEAAEALTYMGYAGWKTEDMLAGLDGIIALAAASGEDLGEVSDIVTDSLTAFGLKADSATHYANLLATAATNANTNVHMMGQAFKYIAPVAGSFGVQAEQVAESLGLIANQGIKSSQAGTSLRRIMTNVGTNNQNVNTLSMIDFGISFFEGDVNTEKMKEYTEYVAEQNLLNAKLQQYIAETKDIVDEEGNINARYLDESGNVLAEYDELISEVFETRNRLESDWWAKHKDEREEAEKLWRDALTNVTVKDWNTYIDEWRAVWKTLDDDQQIDWAKRIGGQQGVSAWLALMNAPKDEIDQLRESIASADEGLGAAHEMSSIMLDNLKGDVTLLTSALEGLKLVISDDFKDSLRGFVQMLTEEVGHLNEAFKEGGVLGMFLELADWMINGITDALTTKEITTDEAKKFGKAIGDFVGRIVRLLITDAPEIIGGLFEAGFNITQGLVDGLFAGLFGTGSGTVTGYINGVKEEEKKAIADAESSATKAQGILGYMDSLRDKYGEAAEKTAEWAKALEELKQVYPEINEFIKEEGGQLSLANAELMTYLEKTKERQIIEAKRKAIDKYVTEYTNKLTEKTDKEIEAEMARAQAEQARKELIEYVQSHEAGYTGEGYTTKQIYEAALSYANEFGYSDISYNTLETLWKTWDEQDKVATKATEEVNKLADEAEKLREQMELAEKALQNLEYKAKYNVTNWIPSGQFYNDYYGNKARNGHAKGLWDVPYDDYAATLHRGEMVLTASQARDYRAGQNNIDFTEMEDRIVAAIFRGMENANVTAIVTDRQVANGANRFNGAELDDGRFRP